jgi:toxin-antitoxin system PIN domain toxin
VILLDVNVLLYAHKEQSPRHAEFRRWLEQVLDSDAAYGMAELVVSAFIRIATHPRIFDRPSSLDEALRFASQVLAPPHCVRVSPGPRHWEVFEHLLTATGAKGNLVPDAYLAALAIESGCEWITTDRDYARFPGLRWRHPLG